MWLGLKIVFFLAGFSSGFANSPTVFDPNFRGAYFEANREFPNFFLPEPYRSFPADKTIPPEIIEAARAHLEGALNSIFHNLTVPILPSGSDRVENIPYFAYLTAQLRKIDPLVKVMPSSGVVRAAVSFVYSEILSGLRSIPSISAEDTLTRLTESRTPIPGWRVRGVGSDFDILLKGSSPAKMADLIKAGNEITASAETHFNARKMSGAYKRSFFTIPDFKSYNEQIERATAQGGSSLDWLAFELGAEGQPGRFIEPVGQSRIVSDFLRGFYSYLPPGETEPESPDKQTIRGFRALIELPFLRLKDERRLRLEIQRLLEEVRAGKSLDRKTLEQFQKMVRNARFSAGNNRLFRSAEGTLERLLLELCDAVRKQNGGAPLIPEFGDRFSLGRRDGTQRELNGLSKDLLMPMDEFLRSHTAKVEAEAGPRHVIYHGTPTIENGLAILRGGLVVSGGRNEQGTAAKGRGVYGTRKRQYALRRAGIEGIVFELEVPSEPRLNVLDLGKHGNDRVLLAIKEQADREGKDFHEVLARDHGIDIIVDGHILIQNLEAVKVPENLDGVLKAIRSMLDNQSGDPRARLSAYPQYVSLARYIKMTENTKVSNPPPFLPFFRARMAEAISAGSSREAFLLSVLTEPDLSVHLLESLGEGHPLVGEISRLIAKWSKAPAFLQAELSALEHKERTSIPERRSEGNLPFKTRSRLPAHIKAKRLQLAQALALSDSVTGLFFRFPSSFPSLRLEQSAHFDARPFYVDSETGRMEFRGMDGVDGSTGARIQLLLDHMAKGQTIALTADERKLIDYFVRNGSITFTQAALAGRAEARECALEVLRTVDTVPAVSVVRILMGLGELNRKSKKKATHEIAQRKAASLAIAPLLQQEGWRAGLRDRALALLGSETGVLKHFPWDRKNVDDLRALRDLALEPTDESTWHNRLRDLQEEVWLKEKWRISDNLSRMSEIQDPALLRCAEALLRERELIDDLDSALERVGQVRPTGLAITHPLTCEKAMEPLKDRK